MARELNEQEKSAAEARHKEDAATQKKLNEKIKKDHDKYVKATKPEKPAPETVSTKVAETNESA